MIATICTTFLWDVISAKSRYGGPVGSEYESKNVWDVISAKSRYGGPVGSEYESKNVWDVISAKSRSRAAQRPMTQSSDLVPRNHMCIEYRLETSI